MKRFAIGMACAAGACCIVAVPCASAAIVYSSQARTITAITTADANTVTASAPNFQPFDQTVESSTLFIGPLGVPRPNRARTTITSILDANGVRAAGDFQSDGGENENGEIERGEGDIDVFVTFAITETTPFGLVTLPRPSMIPGDAFELKLRDETNDETLFEIDETTPPTGVDFGGTLAPGEYSLRYRVEFSGLEPDQTASFDMQFTIPAPSGVVAMVGGAMWASRRRRA